MINHYFPKWAKFTFIYLNKGNDTVGELFFCREITKTWPFRGQKWPKFLRFTAVFQHDPNSPTVSGNKVVQKNIPQKSSKLDRKTRSRAYGWYI